jgi:hypothetical protein
MPSDGSASALPTERVALTILFSVLFVSHAAQGAYTGLGAPPPGGFGALTTIAMLASIWAWFWAYSRRNRIAWVMDMGWFLAAAWPVLIPYYVIRAERGRGVAKVGLFCFTYAAAWLVSLAISIWCRVLVTE